MGSHSRQGHIVTFAFLIVTVVFITINLSGFWRYTTDPSVSSSQLQVVQSVVLKPQNTDRLSDGRPPFQTKNSSTGHSCSHVSMDRPWYPLRSKLMIIMSETKDRKGRLESLHVADNFSQYCKKHGYLFRHHLYETDPELGVFGTRWRDARRWWYMADWLLLVDSDTIVANLSRTLDPFLDGPEHVLLHWRPNREVTAAAVAFRTTEFGRCFLDRWLSVIQTQMMRGRESNADNGALLLLLAEFLEPAIAQKCASSQMEPLDLIRCYEDVNRHFGEVPTSELPIRIFPLLAGFWRQHEGVVQQMPKLGTCYAQRSVETMMFYRCWSNDVLLSGWKQIGAQMWPEIGQHSTLAKCPFNTQEDELMFATTCCLHQFPGCRAPNGTNLCRNPVCQAAGDSLMQARADLGFGVCRFVMYDTRWQQPPGLPSC